MAGEKTTSRAKTRRSYSDEFKAKVMAECEELGASLARVAMADGINDNVVHRWRQLVREGRPRALPAPRSKFVPIMLAPADASSAGSEIRIEVHRGATAITVNFPASAAGEVRSLASRLVEVIRIDAVWLARSAGPRTSYVAK